MEKLVAKIEKRAATKLSRQILWYEENRDVSFSKTMMRNVLADLDALCASPHIGRIVPQKGKREYRVFVSNKKCIIKYWFNPRTLYVVDIVFTDTHSPRFF